MALHHTSYGESWALCESRDLMNAMTNTLRVDEAINWEKKNQTIGDYTKLAAQHYVDMV